MSPFARQKTHPTPPLKPTGRGTVTEKFFASSLPPEKQQKQLPKTGGDSTSLFKLGAGVLLASGVLAPISPSKVL
jgi:LPXTG-motif cell wall-anchored protein